MAESIRLVSRKHEVSPQVMITITKTIYVDRTVRSEGIGKLLLQGAFDFSEAMNWKKVEVGVQSKA